MLRLRRMPLAQLRLRALLKPSQSKPYGFASSPKGESFIKVKIMSETKLSHFDASGSAVMVDVREKPVTARQAVARGIITMNAAAFAAVRDGTAQKGDVLGVARIAGIMAAKRTIFDLLLPRLLADDPITAEDIARLGEGGLCLGCAECHWPNCGFGHC